MVLEFQCSKRVGASFAVQHRNIFFALMGHFHRLRWIHKVVVDFLLLCDSTVIVESDHNATTGRTGWPRSYKSLLESNSHSSNWNDFVGILS